MVKQKYKKCVIFNLVLIVLECSNITECWYLVQIKSSKLLNGFSVWYSIDSSLVQLYIPANSHNII